MHQGKSKKECSRAEEEEKQKEKDVVKNQEKEKLIYLSNIYICHI